MKRLTVLFSASLLLAACAADEVINTEKQPSAEVPITFSTMRQNVTRAASMLEDNNLYNFGVWASKVSSGASNAQAVMANYLVGYSDGVSKGYDKTNGSTWAGSAGTTSDHTSQWFYEGLGKSQYTYDGSAGFYKASDTGYMSANDNQYLRYWDLAYTYTNFYCYTPYQASGVTCNVNADGSAVMEFSGTTLRDRYDNPLNSNYDGDGTDASKTEFMYAGVQATNASLQDIIVPFKHMGSQVFMRFYEDIPGYKVEIIELSGDDGNMGSLTGDVTKGIQATPSVKNADGTTYSLGSYNTTSGATITFATNASASFAASGNGATSSSDNLMFKIPSANESYTTVSVPSGFGANLTDLAGLGSTTHKIIPEKVNTGATQDYSWSPTVYYPVPQPAGQTGYNLHITYRIIADDNKEVITVHNANVYVSPDQADWGDNKRYTYTFRFTKNSTGTTNPGDAINPTSPTPDATAGLFPIVFDNCSIDPYQEHNSDHGVN